jgi:hypothetical protein
MEDFKRELLASAARVAPPSGVSMWIMLGNHLDDWIKLATLFYIVLQAVVLIMGKWLQWSGRLSKGKGDE